MRQQLSGFESSRESFVRLLASWFRGAARELPWRKTRDPYAIWVAEVMLQQTQARTVVGYWERWMRILPTPSDLASASTERILKLWEGLGYYSRAMNLRRAAQMIQERWNGVFPSQEAQLLELPGVGRYTAGAIGSIAFGKAVPIVDGNVARVLARYLGIQENIQARASVDQLWAEARLLVEEAARQGHEGLLPPTPVRTVTGDFNEALMELGAVVCTVATPRCGDCPVNAGCFARANGVAHELPRSAPKPKTFNSRNVALLLEFNGRLLVQKRPKTGVNANFWQFPQMSAPGTAALTTSRVRRLFGLGHEYALARVASIRHSVTRHRIVLEVFHGSGRGNELLGGESSRWVTKSQLSRLPLTAAHRRIAKHPGVAPGP